MKNKKIHNTFALLLLISTLSCHKYQPASGQTVNPILGDLSFIETYGFVPDENTSNELRIATHLAYVEKLLRERDVSELSAQQRAGRNHLLDLLHDYHTTGIFPRNYDYAGQRKPCFIDRDGRICAVGYLLEHTAGRDVAEYINSKFRYEELMNMYDPLLDEWIATCGLTKEELAMVQPTYGSYILKRNINLGVRSQFGFANAQGGKNFPFRTEPIPVFAYGISCAWPIGERYTIFTDLLAAHRGYSNTVSFTDEYGILTGHTLTLFTRFTYYSLPLRFGLPLLRRKPLTASLGVVPALAHSARWTYPEQVIDGHIIQATNEDILNRVNPFDLAATATLGYGFTLMNKLQLVALLSCDYSFTNMFENPAESSWQRHRVASAGVLLLYGSAGKMVREW